MQCRMCHRQRIFHSVVKKQLDQTQPDLNKMRYQQLWMPFLTRGCQSLFLCDDLLTSCVDVMCLIYPTYNALSDLEQFPQETRDLDISPGLQSRDSKLELLAKCPELSHKRLLRACVATWIYCSGAEETLWAHGVSSVNPKCVRFAAHTEPACLARLACSACQGHCVCPALYIWVLSCWATEVHLQGHHLYIKLTWG